MDTLLAEAMKNMHASPKTTYIMGTLAISRQGEHQMGPVIVEYSPVDGDELGITASRGSGRCVRKDRRIWRRRRRGDRESERSTSPRFAASGNAASP